MRRPSRSRHQPDNLLSWLQHRVIDRLDNLDRTTQAILANQEKIMATLDEVLTDVTDEGTKLDSLSALIAGLKQQIADALAGTTLPPAVQAKIDAVFAGVEANKAKVQAALDANVPPAPTP